MRRDIASESISIIRFDSDNNAQYLRANCFTYELFFCLRREVSPATTVNTANHRNVLKTGRKRQKHRLRSYRFSSGKRKWESLSHLLLYQLDDVAIQQIVLPERSLRI